MGLRRINNILICPNSAFEIFKNECFCDFAPRPSLGVFEEGQPTPWSRSSLLRSDEKVAGHSKNLYLQH